MKYAFVDYRTSIDELTSLKKLNISPILVPKCCDLYDAIDGHPDIQIHIINNNHILIHKNMPIEFINTLKNINLNVSYSTSRLTSKYPYDIPLNAINLDNFFIHNLKYTDKTLLNLVSNKIMINTNQGYTKCSSAIVSNKALITSDKSIINSLKDHPIDLLYVPPGDIVLSGLDYGFIGGCCGLISENEMAFFGDLDYYSYGLSIKNFLNKHNVKPICLKRHSKLIDRGSLLFIDI